MDRQLNEGVAIGGPLHGRTIRSLHLLHRTPSNHVPQATPAGDVPMHMSEVEEYIFATLTLTAPGQERAQAGVWLPVDSGGDMAERLAQIIRGAV